MFNLKFENIIKDVIAGLTTSFAALALGAAFGVQSGRGALAGMLSAAIIPIVASILGGTRIQASGPTAPMTAVTLLVVAYAYQTYGSSSELANGFITLVMIFLCLILVLAGILKLGKFIKLVPNVVTLGFMNGIAVLIWWDQIKKLFGLGGVKQLGGELWQNLAFAFSTLIIILVFPKLLEKVNIPEKLRPFIPGTLVTIIAATYIFVYSKLNLERVDLGPSIGNFQQLLGLFTAYLPTSKDLWTSSVIFKALEFALQLSILAYLDSLLTSLFIDKTTKTTSNQNKELVAQGFANLAAGLVGGIPGAQATIRSIILIKEGAQTRLAGVLVGVFTLLGLLVFQNYIVLVASSIFVGVLFKAGWDVFEKDYIKDFISNKWYNNRNGLLQMFFVLYTTLVTVFFNLNFAVISATIAYYILNKKYNFQDLSAEEETSIAMQA